MSDDLRHRIARALADHEQQDLALDADRYPAERWLCCADAVIAVLDQQFPPMLALDPPPEMNPEQAAAWQAQWAEAVSGDTTQRLVVLPPSASDLWRRRTPDERRAYLLARRDEAVERGIPGDLIDLMIQDAEARR